MDFTSRLVTSRMNRVEKLRTEPFYSTNHFKRPTASELIQEAKASLSRPSRPFTPHPRGRIRAIRVPESDLNTLLEPIAPPIEKKGVAPARRRVRIKSVSEVVEKSPIDKLKDSLESDDDHDYTKFVLEFKSFLCQSIPDIGFVPPYLHTITTNSQDSAENIQIKLKRKKLVLECCYNELNQEHIPQYYRELSIFILRLQPLDSLKTLEIVERLLEISLEDVENSSKQFYECLWDCFQANLSDSKIAFIISQIWRHKSDLVLEHDTILEANLLDGIVDYLNSNILLSNNNIEESGKIYTQLCNTMHNLIASNDLKTNLDISLLNSLSLIVDVKSPFYYQTDLVLVSVKLLSLFSESDNFTQELTNSKLVTFYFDRIIECSTEHEQHSSLLLRLFYILGNLTSMGKLSDDIISETLDDVVALFGIVCEKMQTDNEASCDMLLKMIRYITNISLEHSIGNRLKEMIEIQELYKLLESDDEELMLNTLSCLANLSFYVSSNDVLFAEYTKQVPKWIHYLMNDNIEVVIEVERLLANLTRYILPIPKNCLENLTKVSILLLDHQNTLVLQFSCGILINLIEKQMSRVIIDMGGYDKFFELLDWCIESQQFQLAILAAQGVWNLNLYEPLQIDKLEHLDSLTNQPLPESLVDLLNKILDHDEQ